MQVDPHLGFLGSPIGTFFFWYAGRLLRCGSRMANLDGLWARSVRTDVGEHKLGLGFRARAWQAHSADFEATSLASEVRVSVRHRLRLELVSIMTT